MCLKRVSQSIATSLIQSYRQVGDRTDKWAIVPTSKVNLKKPGKFRTNGFVIAESVLQGHQKSVKLARPLDCISLLRR
ncbi:hypothetical protein QUA35_10705 [Microcoleus sp. N9_B2]|uniref:hypothetical protein n=1 Tax=unclassified Microcoleus TaxID=2642155 RepID=UPI002FD590FA